MQRNVSVGHLHLPFTIQIAHRCFFFFMWLYVDVSPIGAMGLIAFILT